MKNKKIKQTIFCLPKPYYDLKDDVVLSFFFKLSRKKLKRKNILTKKRNLLKTSTSTYYTLSRRPKLTANKQKQKVLLLYHGNIHIYIRVYLYYATTVSLFKKK